MPSYRTAPRTTQSGAVLLVSLMILLIMTVLGIASMSTTTMEEKMAGNYQQQQQAYNAAETALRDAEDWLTNNVTRIDDLGDFNGTNGLFSLWKTSPGATPFEPTFDIYDSNAWESNGAPSHNLLPNQEAPRYIIEYMGENDGTVGGALDPNNTQFVARYAFRITAIGWSADGTARYLLRSHFDRRLN